MKTYFLILVTLCASEVYAQKAVDAPPEVITTVDEYNYLTKGLKRTLEEGADAKSGYTLQDGSPIKMNSYEFTVRPFVKNETGKVVALSVYVKSVGAFSTNTYYLCIPRGNGELLKAYWESIKLWDSSITKAYADLTSYLLAESMGQLEDRK